MSDSGSPPTWWKAEGDRQGFNARVEKVLRDALVQEKL